MVRLKFSQSGGDVLPYWCLNSIMVRLKFFIMRIRLSLTKNVSIPLWFDWNPKNYRKRCFRRGRSQFHYGSIEIDSFTQRAVLQAKSQFHYGSIEIEQKIKSLLEVVGGLNSIMVRLKFQMLETDPILRNKVSIPLWFDWNKVLSLQDLSGRDCLNSIMVRLKFN